MTDEERQKLCADLRHPYQAALKAYTARGESRTYSVFEDRLRLAVEAALAALAQSNASAGLIEAAEYAESLARASVHEDKAECLIGFAGLLRARAADRSGK